ncbi:glycosyltransferase [Vibrio aestuarianus]|uniref:Glycosyltransferase n=1 Tax=Vibrio aestuarianus TaxID=28171 RepID=A0A9X4FH41_9VIBR|nr:glycosyltransferase [Vibrio aestuarianus]MDE1357269.1 glycosyltransferase [Vibrio aestuarianus]
MLFSVVLCVNKKIPFLKDAIDSVLKQEYNNDFELIIVANNCNDDLFEFLEEFDDERIVLLRTKIGQLSFNLNYAVNIAEGEYIVRMDADDISLPNRLAVTEKEILVSHPDVLGFAANLINEVDEVVGETRDNSSKNLRNLLLTRNPFVHPTVAIKKKTLLLVGGYMGGRQSEDYDLWIRLSKISNVNFIYSAEKVLNYRITDDQSRGNVLPYCEVSSYFLREFMLSLNPKYFFAMLFSIIKRVILPFKV